MGVCRMNQPQARYRVVAARPRDARDYDTHDDDTHDDDTGPPLYDIEDSEARTDLDRGRSIAFAMRYEHAQHIARVLNDSSAVALR